MVSGETSGSAMLSHLFHHTSKAKTIQKYHNNAKGKKDAYKNF